MLEEEGYQFMGAAFEVYNQLGFGMAEEIYQQSLEIELALRSMPFQSKCELSVFYKDHKLETTYKPDLLVFGAIVAELKAVRELVSDPAGGVLDQLRPERGIGVETIHSFRLERAEGQKHESTLIEILGGKGR